jgi:hypothetical protein
MNLLYSVDQNFKEYTKPKDLKNNDDVESLFKEEYISVRDPKEEHSDSSSSSSQEKIESFPNESEGKLSQFLTITLSKMIISTIQTLIKERITHLQKTNSSKSKHRLSSSHDFLPLVHTENILQANEMKKNGASIDKQST